MELAAIRRRFRLQSPQNSTNGSKTATTPSGPPRREAQVLRPFNRGFFSTGLLRRSSNPETKDTPLRKIHGPDSETNLSSFLATSLRLLAFFCAAAFAFRNKTLYLAQVADVHFIQIFTSIFMAIWHFIALRHSGRDTLSSACYLTYVALEYHNSNDASTGTLVLVTLSACTETLIWLIGR